MASNTKTVKTTDLNLYLSVFALLIMTKVKKQYTKQQYIIVNKVKIIFDPSFEKKYIMTKSYHNTLISALNIHLVA